jgi:yersiniabactin nonribosomal peptide synthetase
VLVPLTREDARAALAEMLGVSPDSVTDDVDLVSTGLDSLGMMSLATRWRRAGIRVRFADLVQEPTFGGWWDLLARGGASDPAPVDDGVQGATGSEPTGAEFGLAPMQHAYWAGRAPGQPLGEVTAHFYQEFDGHGVDSRHLESAVQAVLARHGMLRVRIGDDGQQRIMARSNWPGLTVHDLRRYSAEAAAAELDRIRDAWSHRALDVSTGQVLDVALSLLPEELRPGGATRVHIDLDMLAGDAMSLRILLADLAAAYSAHAGAGEPALGDALHHDFPRYLAERAVLDAEPGRVATREADRRYWLDRLDDLPAAPALPTVAVSASAVSASTPRVRRRSRWLDPETTDRLRARVREQNLTPAIALAAVFAEVLTPFGAEDRFLLNLPLFDREPLHPDVDRLVGDFTSSILLEWDGRAAADGADSVADRARRLQERFRADAAHPGFSGLDVLRELTRRHRGSVLAPVVFTSALGLGELYAQEVRCTFGDPVWIVSQGPQVLLDAQVTELDGGLLVNWDAREDAFLPGVLDTMFDAHNALLDRLVAIPEAWAEPPPSMVPAVQLAARATVNAGPADLSAAERPRLHDRFFAEAAARGTAPAVCAGTEHPMVLGHAELAAAALAMAGRLRATGVCPGDTVGISLLKGPEQVVTALAVLAAGATYAPIGVELPPQRRERMVVASGAVLVVDEQLRLPEADPLPAPLPGSDRDIAYLLFTSGSTGEPKGVEVAHRAAMATIEDLVDRFGLDASDRTLALSALEFDLSVFDVFAPLAVGGAVVVSGQHQRRDAEAWLDLLHAYRATVLNCVPALLDMLLTATPAGSVLPLRLVLLGGDRVGADLAPRTNLVAPGCRVVGLGGTTETAIHSTAFEVTKPLPAGSCVPYGVPLSGVACRIVDALGRDRPDHVPGELWIGGAGVAAGYRGDPERTSARFVEHEGLRWYRTGDKAVYRPGALIEFLGRMDHQVKVRGHRVELGEIDSALLAHPDVGAAVAVVTDDGPAARIAAAVTPAARRTGAISDADPVPFPPRQPVTAGPSGQDELVSACLAELLSDPRTGAPTPAGAVTDLWRRYLHERGTPSSWEQARASAAESWLRPIADALHERRDLLRRIAYGDADPITLVHDPVLAPDALLAALPATSSGLDDIAAAITEQTRCTGRPARIVEIGARAGHTTALLLDRVAPESATWTLLDPSPTHLAEAEKRLADRPHGITLRRADPERVDDDLRHAFDITVALGSMHQHRDPRTGPALASLLLTSDGLLLALELAGLPPLGLLSAALLEGGFTRTAGSPALDAGRWTELLTGAGFDAVTARAHGDTVVLGGRCRGAEVNLPALRAHLAARLPPPLLPDPLVVVPALPLSGNAKIDRAAVVRLVAGSAEPAATTPPCDEVERRIARVWADLGLGHAAAIGREDDLFALGADSLVATRMVTRLRDAGLSGVSLAGLLANPVLSELAATLTLADGAASSRRVTPDPDRRHEPFPPTDVQWAYWVGRGSGFDLGGVGTHFYSEFDGPRVDIDRLARAWDRLVTRHEMLRAVFDDDGRQRILPEVPPVRIPVTAAGPDDAQATLAALRREMSHQRLDTDCWPLFDVRAVHYRDGSDVDDGEERTRVGISLDNIVVDGLSMMIVFSELDLFYADPTEELTPLELSFRDYVLQVQPGPAELEAAQQYWRERLPELPSAPALPLRVDPSSIVRPEFVRRTRVLTPEVWARLAERAREHGVTVSTVLLAAYAEVLAAWSGRSEVTVNLTLFDRRDVHPEIHRVLGDFTTLLLAAHRPRPGEAWPTAVRRLQEQVWRDLDHRDVSAVWVLRELARDPNADGAGMPVVFTSALGVDDEVGMSARTSYGERVFSLSQTPQVWLDLQVQQTAAGLELAIDAVEELFPEGLVDAVSDTLHATLGALADSTWDAPLALGLPPAQAAVRAAVNDTGPPHPPRTLHERFFTAARCEPGRPAILGPDGTRTYGELAERALAVAGSLTRSGVEAGEPVAVALPKGADQIAAVLGVLAAGAVYVPIGVDQPDERRHRILRDAGVRTVLDDPAALADDGPPLAGLVGVDPRQLAYVIYTSGSTGAPKGVEMTHAAAANTVDEIMARFAVGPDDRVLAISALDFDLSVFDVFGLLGCGGAVVTIGENDRRDAVTWLRLATEHDVTIWNTVPTLLDMLLTVVAGQDWPLLLRLALVSGDWVPIDQPGRLRAASGGRTRLVALGGATEAAIWSNALEIDEVPAEWTSIPYGFPLHGQRYRVVDERGRDCPDWVSGELWIGGAGVALGYRADPERTAAKFVTDPSGERWYRTGDIGRYWPDGTLEFLGRVDDQVKVRGHRIELGEIEAAATRHPGVAEVVALAVGSRHGRRLVACVVPRRTSELDEGDLAASLTEHLARYLPAHSVPGTVIVLDALPLTANGKVDRRALAETAEHDAAPPPAEPPTGPTEQLLAAAWSELLAVPVTGRTTNVFSLGADSLTATRMVERLRREEGIDLSLRQVFACPTVAEQAVLIDDAALTDNATELEEGYL